MNALRLLLVVAAAQSWLFSSCMPKRVADDSGSTISASVDGLEEGDESRLKNIRYRLICESGYETFGTKTEEEKVEFSDKGISYTDQCALEIYADKEGTDSYKYSWLSRPPVEGLFYSSNLAQVKLIETADGKLTTTLAFKLFKVYGVEYIDSFPFDIGVDILMAEGEALPPVEELVANISCDNKRKYPSVSAAKVSGNVIKFSFNLSASLMVGLSCSKVVVAKKNAALFEGDLEVFFEKPTKGQAISFPGPFKVMDSNGLLGLVECIAKLNKKCLNVKLPRSEGNIWFAVVEGQKDPTSQPVQLLVTEFAGFDKNTFGDKIKVSDLQAEITSPASKFSFYGIAAENLIKSSNTNPDATKTYLESHKMAPAELAGMIIKGFIRVSVLGFKSVGESILNAKSSARWIVKVKASKADKQESYLVGGSQPYFYSISKGAAQKFFDPAAVKADPSQFALFSYEGASSKPGACKVGLTYFTDAMSSKDSAEIAVPDSMLDSCRLPNSSGLASLNEAGWNLQLGFLLWDWHTQTL